MCRARSDARSLSAFAILIVLFAAWAFARLYVFPLYVVLNGWQNRAVIPGAHYFFFPAMWGLLALHVYWYYLFLQMGLHFIFKGETVDLQQKISKKEKFGQRSSALSDSSSPLPSDTINGHSKSKHA